MSGGGIASYRVENHGWTDDMRAVDYSIWAIANGRPTRLHQRHVDLIGKNEYSAVGNVDAPFAVGKIVLCVSYELEKRRVNVIDFFTNESVSPLQREIGEMTKLRESIVQMDNSENLCAAMPKPIAGLN